MIIFLFLLIWLFLSGCSILSRKAMPELPVVNNPSFYTLESIGQYSMALGGIALILVAILRVACFFPATSFLLVFAPLLSEATALALTAIVIGGALEWIGSNYWVIFICAFAIAVIYLWKHKTIFYR